MIVDELILKISGDIEALKAKLNEIEKNAEDAGKRTGENFSKSFTAVLGAMLGSAAFQKIFSFFSTSVNAAINYERNLRSLQATARAASVDFDQLNSVVKKLGSDGVLSIDQATMAVKSLVAQGFSINRAFDVLDAAKKVGFFNNIVGDAGYAVLDFVKFIQTGSAELAENLDPSLISVIKSLGGYAKVSQDATAKQELLNAVIEKAKSFNDDYNKSLSGVEKSIRDFDRAQEELYQTIGAGLKDIFAPFMSFLASAAKSFVSFLKELSPSTRAILALGAGLAALVPTIAAVIPLIKALGVSLQFLTAGLSLTPLGAIAIAIGGITAALAAFNEYRIKKKLKEETLEYLKLRDAVNLTATEQQRLNELKNKFASEEKYLRLLRRENATLAEQAELIARLRNAQSAGQQIEEERLFQALSPEERTQFLNLIRQDRELQTRNRNATSVFAAVERDRARIEAEREAFNQQFARQRARTSAIRYNATPGVFSLESIASNAQILTGAANERYRGSAGYDTLVAAMQRANVQRINVDVFAGLLEDFASQQQQQSATAQAQRSARELKDTFFQLRKELANIKKDFEEIATTISRKYAPAFRSLEERINALQRNLRRRNISAFERARFEEELRALEIEKLKLQKIKEDEIKKEQELAQLATEEIVAARRAAVARYLEDAYIQQKAALDNEYFQTLRSLEELNHAKLIVEEEYLKTRERLNKEYAKREKLIRINSFNESLKAAEKITQESIRVYESYQSKSAGGMMQGVGGMLSLAPGAVGAIGGGLAIFGGIISAIESFQRRRQEDMLRREEERKRKEEERHKELLKILQEQAAYQRTLVEQNVKKDDLLDADLERRLRILDLQASEQKAALIRQLRLNEITSEQFESLSKDIELQTAQRKKDLIERDLERKTLDTNLPTNATDLTTFIRTIEERNLSAENILSLIGYARGDILARRNSIQQVVAQIADGFSDVIDPTNAIKTINVLFSRIRKAEETIKEYQNIPYGASIVKEQERYISKARNELDRLLVSLSESLRTFITQNNANLNLANDSLQYLERIAELNQTQEQLLLDISKSSKEIAINTEPQKRDKSIFSVFGGFIESAGFVKAVSQAALPPIVQSAVIQSESIKTVNELLYETAAEHLEVAKEQLFTLKDIFAVLDNNAATQARVMTADEFARSYAEFRRRAIRS